MSNEENLEVVLRHLTSFPDHSDFYENYVKKKEIKSTQDFDDFLSSYCAYLKEIGKWNDEIELTFKIIKEQGNIVKHQKSTSPLFSINTARKLNDNWITEFQEEYTQCFTGEMFFEEITPKRYKTITESRVLHGIDTEKLSQVYSKYSEYNHPFVDYNVACVLYNSKNYTNGLPILKKGVKSILSFPNHYWHNEYGVEGASWLIGDLLYFLGDTLEENNMRNEKIKLLKLLFLYMSRYICMTQSNIKSIDFYSNRGRIVKGNYAEFVGIFGLGVNPDIQYLSDMYLAYQVAVNNNLAAIPNFQQLMWDSMKMYQHGSHIPNDTGGYKDIEDETWMGLVIRGEIRSLTLADKLLKEFENFELNISNSIIDRIFEILSGKLKDDFENYIKKLKEKE